MRQSFLAATFAVGLLSALPAAAQNTMPAVTPSAAPPAAAAAPTPAPAAVAASVAIDPKNSSFSQAQRDELDRTIRQFILDNPKALITSVETYYNKQADTKTKQEGQLNAVPGGLLDDPNTPFVGPKDAKFQIVEFFDYNCGFCKQANPDLDRVIKEQPNIKFIFKELPILSDSSDLAARWAMAANRHGKYLEFHTELMMHQGPLTEDYLVETAKKLGLDPGKMKIDANDQEVRDDLQKNIDLARQLGVRGTPFFIIGKEKIPGAVGYSKMKELIAKERDGVLPAAAAAAATTTPAAAPGSEKVMGVETANAPADTSDLDPSIQRDIEAVRAETKAMVEALTKKAEEMQKAEDAAAKEAAAPAAKK